jgi:hypothetical protein
MKVKFSSSRANDLIGQGTGRTRFSYIFDLALRAIGMEKDITTKAMTHGIVNEVRGLEIASKILGAVSNIDPMTGIQISYDVNDYLSATPDGLGDDFVLDIKCPYSIYNYLDQCNKLPKKYYVQVQVQMMALRVDKGYLLNYLTKPELFGEENWSEYPLEESQRYHIHEIKPDQQIQSDLLEYSEKYYPYIGLCIEMLKSAVKLDDITFFQVQYFDKVRFLKLKETNWIENTRQIYLHDNEFYVKSLK